MCAQMAAFYIPEDPEFLAAVGKVALQHAHLDHMLRLTIKSLAGTTVPQARLATAGYTSAALRDEVKALAKKSLGDGPAYICLRAMLTRAKVLTKKRNDLMHGISAREINRAAEDVEPYGDPVLLDEELNARPLPTARELLDLAGAIEQLVNEMNGFRLHDFGVPAMPDRRLRGV
jgi:hypothetical protein